MAENANKKAENENRTKALYQLKKQLDHLRNMRGSGTELVSVYIPANQPVHDMGSKLREEAGAATNIKSKSTRKNVGDALERIMHHLKSYGNTAPETGVAIFCGNISDNPARTDIELFTVYPPEPLSIQLYRCDSRFFIEPLERMSDIKDTYGLVVLDGRDCTLANLRGTNITILGRIHSMAHAKIRKGGQSARRYERLIEESIEYYYKHIGEYMDRYFVNTTKGILVGGPGPAKFDFVKMAPWNYQIKVLSVQDTGYTDEQGLKELMAKAGDVISAQESVKEKVLIDRFIKEIVSDGMAIYGEANVRNALLTKQASMLLASEGLKWKRYHCKVSGGEEVFINKRADEPAPKTTADGKSLTVLSEKDLIDDLVELADAAGVKVEIVSNETSEGAQFLQSFYGVGAFLRYK